MKTWEKRFSRQEIVILPPHIDYTMVKGWLTESPYVSGCDKKLAFLFAVKYAFHNEMDKEMST